MSAQPITLQHEACPYGFWTEKTDPQTKRIVPGYGANTIFRFPRPVLLSAVTLNALPCGTGFYKPKTIAIEVFGGPQAIAATVYDGALQWQDNVTSIEFSEPVYALAVSLRCDWKEPVSHHSIMVWDSAEWNVPFNIFKHVQWHGQYAPMPELDIPVQPPLKKGAISPSSLPGMEVKTDPSFITFKSRHLNVSFSLRRPFISHLSWDALGERPLNKNFLADYLPYHSSGPWTLDLVDATPPFHWTGTVEVQQNRVIYRNLSCRKGLSLDIEFEIDQKDILLHLTQRCSEPMTLLEAAAWRFVWDSHTSGSISTLAIPRRGNHRNGYTDMRGSWHVTNEGGLAFEVLSASSPVLLQTEQTGFFGKMPTWNYGGFGRRYVFSQIQIGTHPEPFGPVTLMPGEHTAKLRLSVGNVEPNVADRSIAHPGLRRAWGSGFFYRPEQSGLANNSHSVLAANLIYGSADMAVYTQQTSPIPDAFALVRYTLELVLKKGGPHYGSDFEFHHDAAPSLIISAGRIYQLTNDTDWLKQVWPYLKIPIDFILDHLDASGMYTSQFHSGNSGSNHGGSNAWDDIGFGHHDGYSAALAYRALYNAVAICNAIGEKHLAQRCHDAAVCLKNAYVKSLYNTQTGWLAGWRSRDGQLHDYGFAMINGMAIAYGILEGTQAKEVLGQLEKKRLEINHTDFRFGLMTPFMPVPSCDLTSSSRNSLLNRGWRNGLRSDGLDTYGVFCNGCLTPTFAGPYLNALSKCGFSDTADQLCDQLLESFEMGRFDGDRNGAEFYTHEGIRCGYEGSLIHSNYVLAEIAKHKGWVKPVQPEWWPAL